MRQASYSFFESVEMAIIVIIIPININNVGISPYNIIPNNNAERGSAPAVNMATLLTSI